MRLLTPPVVAILMTSTPRAIWRRTARRQSSGPSQVLPEARRISWKSSRMPSVSSIWPAVVERLVPASMMRGPIAQPRAIASRRPSVTPSLEPRLRTVVKPASSVLRALKAASWERKATLSVTPASWPSMPARSLSRWTWLSISPGRTKRSRQIDQLRAFGGGNEAVLHRLDPPGANDDAGVAARRAARADRAECRRG